MKNTPSLLIVTADDCSIGENVSKTLDGLIESIGFGRHLYGGRHYTGHHAIFEKWKVKQSRIATRSLIRFI